MGVFKNLLAPLSDAEQVEFLRDDAERDERRAKGWDRVAGVVPGQGAAKVVRAEAERLRGQAAEARAIADRMDNCPKRGR